jgi:hypothetical protein
MNKRILRSLIFGLTFLTAAPAQAWNWSDFVPSWLKSRPAAHAQPVHNQRNDIEAQRVVPAAASPRSWYSAIFSNPLSGVYASFSAWWNKSNILRAQAQQAERKAEIISKARRQLYNRLKTHKIALSFKEEEKKSLANQLDNVKNELNALKASDLNFAKKYEDLQKKERALQSALIEAEHEKILAESNATLAQSQLKGKEAEEAAAKAALEHQARIAAESAQKVDAITHEAQANNSAIRNLMQEMSDLKQKEHAQSQARIEELQLQLQKAEQEKERLANDQKNYLQQKLKDLEQLSLKLALLEKAQAENDEQEIHQEAAILKKEAQESGLALKPQNPMLNSGDFLRIENEPAKPESGKLLDNDYQLADDIINPELINDSIKNEYLRVAKLSEGMPSWDFVKDQIKLGALWAYRIATDQKSEIKKLEKLPQSDHLNAVNALNWLWYAHALKRNEGYVEGTNTVEDFDDHRFYNVIFNYAQRVNPKLSGTLADPKRHVTLNPFADSRESSHFKESQKKYRHYGIDARYGQRAYAQQQFPAGKRHLLFGKIDENKKLFFTKPENYGLYLYDGVLSGEDGVGGHTLEFLVAQARKLTAGADDQPHYRKERIPANFSIPFSKLIKDSNLSEELKKKLLEHAKSQGLQTLIALPEEAQSIAGLKEFKSRMENEYGTLDNRWGRENRITRQDIYTSFNPKYLKQ